MGLLHAGILNALADCSVVAICEKDLLVRKLARTFLKNVHFYNEVSEMMSNENLDAIYVTTPISTHGAITSEITRTNKVGLFVEKPLAESAATGQTMADSADHLGITNMVGYQKRFSPSFKRAKSLIQEETLGEIRLFKAYSFVSAVFARGKGWRFECGQGGSLVDLGSHLLDLLLWYFGEPYRARARLISIHSSAVDDYASGVLEFKQGLVGQFDVSWSMPGYRLPETKIEIYGEHGKIVLSDDYLELISSGGRSPLRSQRFDRPELYSGVDFLLGDPEYCVENEHFLQSLRDGNPAEPNFESAVQVNRLIDMMLREKGD